MVAGINLHSTLLLWITSIDSGAGACCWPCGSTPQLLQNPPASSRSYSQYFGLKNGWGPEFGRLKSPSPLCQHAVDTQEAEIWNAAPNPLMSL